MKKIGSKNSQGNKNNLACKICMQFFTISLLPLECYECKKKGKNEINYIC
jgi:hypothetical protein